MGIVVLLGRLLPLQDAASEWIEDTPVVVRIRLVFRGKFPPIHRVGQRRTDRRACRLAAMGACDCPTPCTPAGRNAGGR